VDRVSLSLRTISPCLYQPTLLERRGEGRGTYRRKVCSDPSLAGSWDRTAGRPWELDVEAGLRGECEVNAEGKQQGDCGEKGGHG
jgi:hypothetical protein